MENIYRRRLSLVLSLVLVLNEMLSPLFIWADEGTASGPTSQVISGKTIMTEDTGSVTPPLIDTSLTGSSETSSGTYEGYATGSIDAAGSGQISSGSIILDEQTGSIGSGSTLSGVIMESSGMLDMTGSTLSGEVLPIPTQPEEDMSTQLIESLTESMHPEREILIEFKQDTPNVSTPSGSSVLTEIEQEQDVSIVDIIPNGNIAVARIAPSPSLAIASISDGASYVGTIETEQTKQDVMDTLRDDPRIASVQPNYVYELSSTESTFGILNTEPSIAYVSDILSGAPQSVSGINTGIIVGVLDTGIAYNHPELIDKMWNGTNCLSDTGGTLGGCIHGYDFGEDDPDPTEGDMFRGHGTHVAGIIERTIASGIASGSTVPRVQLMALKVYGHKINAQTSTIIKAINFAKYNGAKVLSVSFGSLQGHPQSNFDFDMLTYNAIRDFPGLFIAAAGNNGRNIDYDKFFPAGFATDTTVSGATIVGNIRVYSGSITIPGLPNMLSIGAVNGSGALVSFSNYGTGGVHIAAPGIGIYSTYTSAVNSRHDTVSGVYGWTIENASNSGIFQSNSGETRIFTDMVGFVGSGVAYSKNETAYLSKSFSGMTGAKHIFLQVPVWCNTPYSGLSQKDSLTIEYSTGGVFARLKRLDKLILFGEQDAKESFAYGHTGTLATVTTEIFDVGPAYTIRFGWYTDGIDEFDGTTGKPFVGCYIEGGSGMTTTYYDDGELGQYTRLSGTSMATPHISGIAALAWSLYPNRSREEIRSAILTGGDPDPTLVNTMISGKRANIEKTLETLASSSGSTPGSGSGVSVGTITAHSVSIIRGNTAHIMITTIGSGTVGLSLWKTANATGGVIVPSLNTVGSTTTADIPHLDFATEYTFHISFCSRGVCDRNGATGSFITPAGISLAFSGTATGSTSTYIEGSSTSGYTAPGTGVKKIILMNTGTLSSYEIDFGSTSLSASGSWDGFLLPPVLSMGSMNINTSSGAVTALRIENLGNPNVSLTLSGGVARVRLPIFGGNNGTVLQIYRANSSDETYALIGSCTVTGSVCEFMTDHFSSFALVLPSQGSGGGGGSGSGGSNTGSTNSGSTNTGSTNTGSTNSGSTNTGSTNTGSTNSGSVSTGSTNTGSVGGSPIGYISGPGGGGGGGSLSPLISFFPQATRPFIQTVEKSSLEIRSLLDYHNQGGILSWVHGLLMTEGVERAGSIIKNEVETAHSRIGKIVRYDILLIYAQHRVHDLSLSKGIGYVKLKLILQQRRNELIQLALNN